MNEKYLEKLEFNKIREILEGFTVTYIGKQLALELMPSNNEEIVKGNLTETTEAHRLIYIKGAPCFIDFPNITVHIKGLISSSTLSAKSLLDLANLLRQSRLLKEYLKPDSNIDISFVSKLASYFNSLYTNTSIENTIFSSIIDENTIDDKASFALANIRKDIKKTESGVRAKLNSFLNSKYVQEPVITIRSRKICYTS